MCSDPLEHQLRDGRVIVGKCRKCSDCKAQSRVDWIGRLVSEASTSAAVWFVTLTYGGGDTTRAYVLNYKDVQDWLKRLRKAGHRVRYVCVGEHGEQNHRAHWHLLLFWHSPPPKWPLGVQLVDPKGDPSERHGRIQAPTKWVHGYSQFEVPRSKQASIAYILDYMKKPATEKLRFSRGQALGFDGCVEWARKQARAGLELWPNSAAPFYSVEGNARTKPNKREREAGILPGQLGLYRYVLSFDDVRTAAMARAYLDEWGWQRPDEPLAKLRIHPALQLVVDDLNDHWRVTAGERRALLGLGLEEPPEAPLEPSGPLGQWFFLPEHPVLALHAADGRYAARLMARTGVEVLSCGISESVFDALLEGGSDAREAMRKLPPRWHQRLGIAARFPNDRGGQCSSLRQTSSSLTSRREKSPDGPEARRIRRRSSLRSRTGTCPNGATGIKT